MLKKSLIIFLVGLLVQATIFVQSGFAGQKLSPEQVKSTIEGIGMNNRNMVKIKLANNKKYKGFVRSMEDDKFVLVDIKQGAISVAYIDVQELKEEQTGNETLGTVAKKEGVKAAIGIGAAVAAIGITIAIIAASAD